MYSDVCVCVHMKSRNSLTREREREMKQSIDILRYDCVPFRSVRELIMPCPIVLMNIEERIIFNDF